MAGWLAAIKDVHRHGRKQDSSMSSVLKTALLPRHCPLKHINFDYSSLFLQLRALRIKDLKKKRKEKLIIIII